MSMKEAALPRVSFGVSSPNKAPKWLIHKKTLFEEKWNRRNDGARLLRKVVKTCNLSFPRRIVDSGIKVTIIKHSTRAHGDSLGATSPTEPNRISMYVRKRDTYLNLKSTLCHEIIHSLMWSKYYYDNRRKPVSFFADVFADELVTTLLEEKIVKGKPKRIDFEWALDNACVETSARLKNLKRTRDYEELLDTLGDFFRQLQKSIRRGSDILKERERALREILSPGPSTIEK
jgi:hypothetical protein